MNLPKEERAPGTAGYLVASIVASLVYIGWLVVDIQQVASSGHATVSFGFSLAFSLFLWLSGGFGATLALMVFPWIIAVWAYRKSRWSGPVYFPALGALFMFVIGCIAASLSPKPLWIEDQTFLEGARIAAERQGLSFFVSGVLFGVSYWLVSERAAPRLKRRDGPASPL